MADYVIDVNNLTKDYGFGRGIFDVSLHIPVGICHGYLGPNGAGKTTTIRHIMGFQKADDIELVKINDVPIWNHQSQLLSNVGYLPGELAFPEKMKGWDFVKYMAGIRHITDLSYANELANLFKLDPSKVIKSMSLGEKRKLAIVVAFLHNPDILVLDEPTSGLDPVMQQVFIDYIKSLKAKGKTILLSSHIYAEVEALCDKISIIKAGGIVSEIDIKDIKIQNNKKYKIEFSDQKNFNAFVKNKYNYIRIDKDKLQIRIQINDKDINSFLKTLSKYSIKFISEDIFTLEDYFLHFYQKEEKS